MSVRPTDRSPATCWPGTTGPRGERVHFLTGTDEHSLNISASFGRTGIDPTGLGRRDGAAVEGGLAPARDLQRRLHPHDRSPATRRRSSGSSSASTRTAGTRSTSGPTGPVLRVLRGVQHGEGARSTGCVRSTAGPVERMEEENYFFRLSEYRTDCWSTTRTHPKFVQPETRRNEVLSLIRGGLQDFSISRTTSDWGIPLPWDTDHVMLRLVRRTHQLHHRGGFGTDEERFATRVAGRRAARSARTSSGSTP